MSNLNKIKNLINSAFNRKIKFEGNYENWEQALKNSKGYNDNVIINKTINSFEKVLASKALYERDSFLFYKEKFDENLIKNLKKIFDKKGRKIYLCDYGGSLGSLYFQHKKLFQNDFIEWNVLEQKAYVDYANNRVNISNLNFFSSFENILNQKKLDVILFSSVLQYLRSPYEILSKIIDRKIPDIIITRTPFLQNAEKIMIQKVPKHIYKSSYPIRILNLSKIISLFEDSGYKLNYKNFDNENIDNFDYQSICFEIK